ncbi:MBL fold metallo-hydrolase [Sedimentibacter sp. B4]|uniref:MBL fold metallo-hydrolase n=1 Tax=Sedimentibacter sp. B4 TaxID=304766 RepID=UPI0003004D6F|nr:MBL fold metallo-hydrolase [Sedimentibacter sp. B4]
MSIAITIHRGTSQIGGSITEISTEQNRILIDFGTELSENTQTPNDSEMIKLVTEKSCDGVFFTHYHGDHTGLMNQIPKGIPIYIGDIARRIMINIRETLRQYGEVAILKDTNRIKPLVKNVAIQIGDIKVTPYFVDHSAYDAYMLLVEAEGKRILHTGDFRTHGRLGKGLFPTLKHYVCRDGRPVDVLISEGTMLSRSTEKVMTEQQMQKEATKLLKQHRYAFLVCSSTNMDSLASFHQAAKINHIPMIANWYIVKQCELFTEYAGSFSDVYRFDNLYKLELERILSDNLSQEEHMKKYGFLFIVNEKEYYQGIMERFRNFNPILIYSMWDGYLDDKRNSYNIKMADMVKKWNVIHLHTSGHATADTISEVIKTVRPQKAIIPIHTEMGRQFKNLQIGEYKDKVIELKDGEVLKL